MRFDAQLLQGVKQCQHRRTHQRVKQQRRPLCFVVGEEVARCFCRMLSCLFFVAVQHVSVMAAVEHSSCDCCLKGTGKSKRYLMDKFLFLCFEFLFFIFFMNIFFNFSNLFLSMSGCHLLDESNQIVARLVHSDTPFSSMQFKISSERLVVFTLSSSK